MRSRFEKNMRIVVDLITYCHMHGARDFHVDFSMEKEDAIYRVVAGIENMSPQEIEYLAETLNTPRQQEVEESYWGLSGELATDPVLDLIGIMVDKAEVTYKDGKLTIMVYRRQ